MLQVAFQQLQAGNARQAEAITRQLLASRPDEQGALLLLGMSLDAQGRTAETLPLFERLTTLNPGEASYWSNLGGVQRTLGRMEPSRTSFEKALALDANDTNALFHLGVYALDNGDFAQARTQLLHALEIAPDDALIRIHAANACYECGDFVRAESLVGGWREWIADPLLLNEMAWLLTRLNKPDEAEQAFSIAEAQLGGHPRIAVRRAAFLERTNRVAEAEAIVAGLDEVAVDQEGLTSDLAIIRASISARGDDVDEACRLHEDIVGNPALIRREPQLVSQLARLHDRRDDPESAMRWLSYGRKVQVDQLRGRVPQLFEPDADPIGIVRKPVTPEQYAGWSREAAAPAVGESPIFVVGFPRSGTTMLETMLDSLPELASMDERAYIADAAGAMEARGYRYPAQLGELGDDLLDELRAGYWTQVRERAGIGRDRQLVDKNPLNIMRLPMIHRLFPNARIILALRHPCDVVLSNYMQTFMSPAYIKLCSTIESTAQGYADTFAFWVDQAAVLQPRILEVRYEDIVDDIDGQSRRIADFLGVPWNERMVNFHEHAKDRGFISTPSYHQVVQPLNRKGIARWERYRDYLQPALPILEPWLQRWGYSA